MDAPASSADPCCLDDHPLLQVVHALRPTLIAFRAQSEASASPHPQVFETLGMAGMFRLLAPRSVGGEEAPPPVLALVLEELARTDPSVAWCVWNAFGAAYAAARAEPDVAQQLYADPKRFYGFSAVPAGKARAVDGGVVVSGRWPIVTGCQLAGGFTLMCAGGEAPGDRPPFTVLLPTDEVTVHDTWRVGAMRGTGSHAVSVSEVFVPSARVVPASGPPREPGPLYRIPMYTLFGPGCAAIGLAMHLYDIKETLGESGCDLALVEDALRVYHEFQSARLRRLGLPPARLVCRDTDTVIDCDGAASSVGGGTYDVLRCVGGRRSRDQADSLLDWGDTAEAVRQNFPVYGWV